MQSAILDIGYLNEDLVNLCTRFRDSNTQPYSVDEISYLASHIIDTLLMPRANVSPSDVFDSYNIELFKYNPYIIVEELEKDYHIPAYVGIPFMKMLSEKTEQLLNEYRICKDNIAKWYHFPDSVFLLLYRAL